MSFERRNGVGPACGQLPDLLLLLTTGVEDLLQGHSKVAEHGRSLCDE